jgi:hypothetical protein
MSLWNACVVISSVVGAGTALVGNFAQGAQIDRRGGRTVEASNSPRPPSNKKRAMLRREQGGAGWLQAVGFHGRQRRGVGTCSFAPRVDQTA